MIDLVYVTYNSEKWLNQCFESVLHSQFDLKEINVYVVDNASTDHTVAALNVIKHSAENLLNSFQIIQNDKNEGFGKANNIGFSAGNSDIVCFLNIDTALFDDSLAVLNEEIKKSDEMVGVWEFRQFPYEHPKLYDPLTGETQWVSGAAFAIRRDVYDDVNGFDENLFMYVEDVDLSWRIRCAGYKLCYVPKVRIYHYTYLNGKVKMTQHVYSIINNLLVRYRFGTAKDVLVGHLLFWKVLFGPEVLKGARRNLFAAYIAHFKIISLFSQKGKYKKLSSFRPCFDGFDYNDSRRGAFYEASALEEYPLVSVIVRTHNRPQVLRETLQSLRRQTYPNLEIVVVEDGENHAQQMIETEFGDCNINYFATMQKYGRSKAGNEAIRRAKGKYINFLDDDDLFYADHIECLVNSMLHSPECKAAYAVGAETAIKVISKDPYIYEIKGTKTVHKQPFDRVMLCHHNYIPIQCIMFEKSLFDQFGGLDETVDALEDWDLWVRYAQYTDFAFVDKTTSIYRVPFEKKENEVRQKTLDDALVVMRKKHKQYIQPVNSYELAQLYSKII